MALGKTPSWAKPITEPLEKEVVRPIADKVPDELDPFARTVAGGPIAAAAGSGDGGGGGGGVGSVVKKVEETVGGRKTDAEKEATGRQEGYADEAYTGTKAELDKLEGADNTYVDESTKSAQLRKDSRANVNNTYTLNANNAVKDYKGARDAANSQQLKGDSEATAKYRAARNPVYEKHQAELQKFSDEAANQANNAEVTYKNNIQPRLQDIMSTAQSESGGAMSLKDAGDPNNSVNKAWRGMYEGQAQGVGKQALADVGVMNSLGAQATANQLGGMGGAIGTNQLLALQGQNMGQSGQAYARAQQQMQSLREQGLEAGRQESNSQYNRGQGAKDRYAGSVADYANADASNQDRQTKYRGEREGYAGKGFGLGKELVNDDYGIDQDRVGLEAGLSKSAASENLSMGQTRNKEDYEMGDAASREDFSIDSNLSGVRHGLKGDQAGRNISNINQRATTKSGIAANQAGVEQQKRLAGPQILGGLVGAGAKAYGASKGGGGTALAAEGAGDYGGDDGYTPPPVGSKRRKK
jgi:hypothetical protein